MQRRSVTSQSQRRKLTCAAALVLAIPSCKCTQEHPYTPFKITDSAGSALPSASAVAPALPVSNDAQEAQVAPKGVSTWSVDDVPVSVAPDRVIDRALAADFDGDGAKDAVAWTRARAEPPESHATGELVFFGGKTPAGRVVAKTPSFVPSGPGCGHAVRVAKTGSKTVLLDVSAHCAAALVPRSPTRGLLVVAPADERTTVLGLRVADPAPDESFTIAVDSRDRDGDGRDDVRLTVTLKSKDDDLEAAADLAWVDRAAGSSQDRAEPARSLGAFATLVADRAKSKATARDVPGQIENARRLLSSLCAEWGTSRFFDQEGAALACGDVSGPLESLVGSEVRSAVVRRDALGAFAALARDGWYGPALSARSRKALEKEAFVAAPRRAATPRTIDVVPRAGSGLPAMAPLAFETNGNLLVLTKDGVSRVTLPEGRVEDASESVDPWPLAPDGAAAPRWTGVGFPCDRSEVVLLLSDATGAPIPSRPVRLLSPRPGPCRQGSPVPTPRLTLIEWDASKQAGMIAGALFGVSDPSELGPAVPRGAPRSPDGQFLAVPVSAGLLVVGRKAETWTVEDPQSLGDCTISNGAAAAACVANGHVVVLTPEPKKPK